MNTVNGVQRESSLKLHAGSTPTQDREKLINSHVLIWTVNNHTGWAGRRAGRQASRQANTQTNTHTLLLEALAIFSCSACF